MERLTRYTIAVVQMDTQNDKGENLKLACRYVDEAAGRGAKLICFPETMNLCGRNVGEGGGRETIPGYTTQRLAAKAREHGVYIHCGSFYEQMPGEKRVSNTSVIIDPEGNILGRYRKIHVFDGTLQDGTVSRESAKVRPGDEIVTLDTPLGILGMSICYDIRFPELYRLLALKGAQVLFAPANFTHATGQDHWEIILRARAIENGCYLVAADQTGQKDLYRAYGNSMIVDPWGRVLARADEEPGVIYGEIDLDRVAQVRGWIPSLENRRTDVYDVIYKNE